jgi:hypothetical protein
VHGTLDLLHFAFGLKFRISGDVTCHFFRLTYDFVNRSLCMLVIHMSPLTRLDANGRKE